MGKLESYGIRGLGNRGVAEKSESVKLKNLLDGLMRYIAESDAFKKLDTCTQTRDETVRMRDEKHSTRGSHSMQVAANARILATLLSIECGENGKISDEEYTQIQLAEIIGLSHDLGHTPMGHASEVVLSNKIYGNTNGFKHGRYSGVVFEQLYEEYVAGLTEEDRQLLEQHNIKQYVIEGVQDHDRWNSDPSKDTIDFTRANNGNIGKIAGRLADTISFAPMDLYDLLEAPRADDRTQTILTRDMMEGVLRGQTTFIADGPNPRQVPMEPKIQTAIDFYESDEYKAAHGGKPFDYKNVLDDIQKGKISDIQVQIAKEVIAASKKRAKDGKATIMTLSDELKDIRSKCDSLRKLKQTINEPGFISEGSFKWHYKQVFGVELGDNYDKDAILNKVDEELKRLQPELQEKMNELRMECPTFAMVYEMQDELIYNQILYRDTRVLGNAEHENEITLNAMFDRYAAEYDSLSKEEKEKFNVILYRYRRLMPKKFVEFDNAGKKISVEGELEPRAVYAAYKLQQRTNDDVEKEREEELAKDAFETEVAKRGIKIPNKDKGKDEISYEDAMGEVLEGVGKKKMAGQGEKSHRVPLFNANEWREAAATMSNKLLVKLGTAVRSFEQSKTIAQTHSKVTAPDMDKV